MVLAKNERDSWQQKEAGLVVKWGDTPNSLVSHASLSCKHVEEALSLSYHRIRVKGCRLSLAAACFSL